MDLPIEPAKMKAPNFDDFDWDRQELELVLGSLQQDAEQLQETAELVVKYAKRVAGR